MRPIRHLVLLLPLLGGGCAALRAGTDRDGSCPLPEARPMLRAELLFGLRRPDGRASSEAAWRRFLAARVTPRFPDGLTVLSANGQWRGADGRVLREPSRVLVIVTEASAGTLDALQAIRTEYRAAFGQESVGLVLSRACAAFR